MSARALGLAVLVGALAAAAPARAVSGGSALPIAQAPYVAWLGNCTGTLISPTRVLTAAHCLDGADVADAHVLVGIDGNMLTGDVRRLAVPVRGYSEHPKFKLAFPFAHRRAQDATAENDIGLILLKKPVKGIAPVRLAGAAGASAASLVGFGRTAPESATNAGPLPPLQQGALNVLGASECERAYPHAITPSMLCTADRAHQAPPFVMACPGDSGGPVIVQTAAGPVQVGVLSWGAEVMEVDCGERPLPTVAMRVSSFASFIGRAKPVIQPYTTGPGFRHTRLLGTARVGNTVTCKAPKIGGERVRLSYEWLLGTSSGSTRAFRHTRAATLKVTQAIYDRARPANGRILFCIATARNAGGTLSTGLTSTRLKRGRTAAR